MGMLTIYIMPHLVDVDFVALHSLLGSLFPSTGGLLCNGLLSGLGGFLLTRLGRHACCCS